ncbi:MAG: hypothetical protein KGY75_02035, partial [Candidatus Cloacimonetes bacterium]|nr:hypothetical protein [Candidatus Cloacimonadota bacterium]
MKIKKSALLVIGIIIVSLLFSCSDDGGSTGPDEPEPEWQPKTVTVPENMEQSQNPMVQMAVGHINTVNGMMNTYSSFFQPQKSYKDDGPPWEYDWTEGDLTIHLTITECEEADYDYEWTVVLDGSDGEYTYDNWTYIYAKTSNNNSSGHVTIYEQVTDEVCAIVTWNTDESGVFTMTIEDFHGTQTKIELTSNPDGSGEVDYYEQIEGSYVIQFRAEWEADGSGQWWTYDENG